MGRENNLVTCHYTFARCLQRSARPEVFIDIIHVDVFRILPDGASLSLSWLTPHQKEFMTLACQGKDVAASLTPSKASSLQSPQVVSPGQAGLDGLAAALGGGVPTNMYIFMIKIWFL